MRLLLTLVSLAVPMLLHAQSSLGRYHLDSSHPSSVTVADQLREISGLVSLEDGRVFAHNDEYGIIYQIDPSNGKILKRFSLGKKPLKGDFEDITFVSNRFFMVRSDGVLFEFAEGGAEKSVEYRQINTGLTSRNNIEGLCFDPATNSLLLVCKDNPGGGYRDVKAVWSFSLEKMTLKKRPRFLLPEKKLAESSRGNKFHPSGIARNPSTGTFYIIAGAGEAIIEVSADGEILGQVTFPKGVHKQAEGITFLPDGSLLISDEGKGDQGKIARYRQQKQK